MEVGYVDVKITEHLFGQYQGWDLQLLFLTCLIVGVPSRGLALVHREGFSQNLYPVTKFQII